MKGVFLACVCALLAVDVHAGFLHFGAPGQVSAITGLESGGSFYNVEFAYMAFEDIPSDQLAFMGDYEGALGVSLDINEALKTYTLYHDNTDAWAGDYAVPYALNLAGTGGTEVETMLNRWVSYPDRWSLRITDFSWRTDNAYSYALISPVPAPASIWLFLSALGGYGIFNRKRS